MTGARATSCRCWSTCCACCRCSGSIRDSWSRVHGGCVALAAARRTDFQCLLYLELDESQVKQKKRNEKGREEPQAVTMSDNSTKWVSAISVQILFYYSNEPPASYKVIRSSENCSNKSNDAGAVFSMRQFYCVFDKPLTPHSLFHVFVVFVTIFGHRSNRV